MIKFGHYSDRGLPYSDVGYRCPTWDPMPEGKKNVVVLGCSHTYGVGHDNNTHWVAHLSKHNTTKLRYWNLAQPGCSADKMIRILYGSEKLIDPKIIIACWPLWNRRERLETNAMSLTSDNQYLKTETDDTDKHNFLKNVFLLQKFAETKGCATFHCFADETYQEHIKGLNVLNDYTIKNCWPYWDKFEQRVPYDKPDLASDGMHYGVRHHERFAELFLQKFHRKLR